MDMQQNDYAHDCDQPGTRLTSLSHGMRGRESIIADYCRKATVSRESCIWLCIRHGRRYSLIDIPLEQNGQEIGLQAIRKRYSWWKRYSLYSVVGVKEVMARVIAFDKATNRISAAVTAFDCTENISRLERAKAKVLSAGIESGECCINIKGQRHNDEGPCANTDWDREGEEEYCKLKHLDYLDLKHDEYKWLTPMFEYYWQNGINKDGIAVLQAAGFVMDYDALIFDEWFDAANPYGKTVNAFLVVEGWNITLLLQLIGIGVLLTICVVSVVTAASHSIEIGLTAGSYAVGLLAVLLAIFTFLSAIL